MSATASNKQGRLAMATTLAVLAALALMSHFRLIQAGFAFLDSDDATIPLVTTLFRRGELSPFYLQQTYGGTAMTAARALWVALWETCFPGDRSHLVSQFGFSFGVVPVLMTWATYFLVRAWCSRPAAWVVSIAAALGCHFWTVELFERDFYTAYLLLGFALLTLRARYHDPLGELSGRGLFLVGALSGFALYTCRASAIFVAAFFFSEDRARSVLMRFWRSTAWTDRVLRGGALFFAALFAYLLVFDRDLGSFSGHVIRLDAYPNLKIAALLAGLWGIKELAKEGARQKLRCGLLLSGLAVGLLPEILYLLTHQKTAPLLAHGAAGWKDLLAAIAALPEQLRKAMGLERSLGAQASLLLLAAAVAAFARASIREPRLRVIAFATALGLLAFVSVNQTAIAATRYLLPLSPAFAVMLGVLVDRLRARGPRSAATWAGAALIALHVLHQVAADAAFAENGKRQDAEAQARRLVEAFRAEQVRLVIADDYWETNQYTFFARMEPFFISNGRELGIPEAFLLQSSENRVGVLLKHDETRGRLREIWLNQRLWKLRPLQSVGDRQLYIGAISVKDE